jgi:hypothetical protein
MADEVASTVVRTVHCWSGPRSGSTAFMYSWDSRPDTHAIDEPLYAHHLTQRPALFRPYREELLKAQDPNGAAVLDRLCKGPSAFSDDPAGAGKFPVHLFAKHMAKQAVGLDLAGASSAAVGPEQRHIILIRSPTMQLLSFAAKGDTAAHGGTSLDELGLPQLLDIFHAVSAAPGAAKPVVVDYDDLLSNPEGILRSLCAELGISFDPSMLEWQAGPKKCDGLWASHWCVSCRDCVAPWRRDAMMLCRSA